MSITDKQLKNRHDPTIADKIVEKTKNVIINPNKRLEKRSGSKTIIEEMNEMTKEVFKDSIEELTKTGNIKMPILNTGRQSGKTYTKKFIDEYNEWGIEVDKQIQKSVAIPEVKPCEECGRDPIPAGLSSSVNDCKSCGKPKQYSGGFISGGIISGQSNTNDPVIMGSDEGCTIMANPYIINPFYEMEYETSEGLSNTVDIIKEKPKVCECGAESTYGKNAGGHSRYCDFFQGDKL